MDDEFFGKSILITGDVKYVGEDEDPATNPGFMAWKKAFEEIYALERAKEEGKAA